MMALPPMHIIQQHHFVGRPIDQAERVAQSLRGGPGGGKSRNPDLLEIAPSGQHLTIFIDDRHPVPYISLAQYTK